MQKELISLLPLPRRSATAEDKLGDNDEEGDNEWWKTGELADCRLEDAAAIQAYSDSSTGSTTAWFLYATHATV